MQTSTKKNRNGSLDDVGETSTTTKT